MPISPAGTTDSTHARRAPVPAHGSTGFSLIEILVVLVIVGIAVTGAVLSIGGSGEREVENAARRAERLVRLACERAVIGGRDIGFDAVRDGLRFGYVEIDGWRPLGEGGTDELRARPLGRELLISAQRDGLDLVLGDESGREPSFGCFSSGEMTPFVLRIDRADVAQPWQLQGALDGTLTLIRVRRDR